MFLDAFCRNIPSSISASFIYQSIPTINAKLLYHLNAMYNRTHNFIKAREISFHFMFSSRFSYFMFHCVIVTAIINFKYFQVPIFISSTCLNCYWWWVVEKSYSHIQLILVKWNTLELLHFKTLFSLLRSPIQSPTYTHLQQ